MQEFMEESQEEDIDVQVHESIRAAIEAFEDKLNESHEIFSLMPDSFSTLLEDERQRLALKTLLSQGLLGKSWHTFLSWNTFKIVLLEMFCLRQAIGISRLIEKNDDDKIMLDTVSEDLAEPEIFGIKPTETSVSDIRMLQNTAVLTLPSNYSRCLASPVLLSSHSGLQRTAGLTAFQETVQLFIDGTWLLLAGSLVVNQIVNLIRYPSYYPDKLRDIGSLLWTTGTSIGNLLPHPIVSGLLFGFPLSIGMINAAVKAYRLPLPLFDETDNGDSIHNLLNELKQHESGFWQDLLAWLFVKVIPDMVPFMGFLTLLPQLRTQKALEKIVFALLSDGRLTDQDRQTLFTTLLTFYRSSSHITRLATLNALGNVMTGIDLARLTVSQDSEFDENLLKTLLTIKIEAFRELRYLANTWDVPGEENSAFVARLARIINVNYLLWQSGFPQNHAWQLLFWPYQLSKWAINLYLYFSIATALYPVIKCLEEGKQWSFIRYKGTFECNVCADLPIYVGDVNSPESCLMGYLSYGRSADEVLNFIKRFELFNVSILDFTSQHRILANNEGFPKLLYAFKPKLPQLKALRLPLDNTRLFSPPSREVVTAVLDFMTNSTVKELVAINFFVSQESLEQLAAALPDLPIEYMEIKKHRGTGFPQNPAKSLMPVIQNLSTRITHLILDGLTVNNTDWVLLSEKLPFLNVKHLSMKLSYEDKVGLRCEPVNCTAFGKQLPSSKIEYLDLRENCFYGPSCAQELAQALPKMQHPLFLLYSWDNTFSPPWPDNSATLNAFASALEQNPKPRLSGFSISAKVANVQSLTRLALAIRNSSELTYFAITNITARLNLTIFMPEFAAALNQSNVHDLTFSCDPHWKEFIGDLGAIELARYLPDLPNLKSLDFSFNGIGPEGLRALAESLPQSNLKIFNLTGNPFKNIDPLSAVLPETLIERLILDDVHLTNGSMLQLSRSLPKSQIIELSLSDNHIGDPDVASLTSTVRNSSIQKLNLRYNKITNTGAFSIAEALKGKVSPDLWINQIFKRIPAEPSTNLTSLSLVLNEIRQEGVNAICAVLDHTHIEPFAQMIIELESQWGGPNNDVSNCALATDTSSASSLQPPKSILFVIQMTREFKIYITTLFYEPRLSYSLRPRDDNFVHEIIENYSLFNETGELICINKNNPYANTFTLSLLQSSLLSICQTFIHSMSQSALLAAAPSFVGHILYRWGGHSHEEAERFAIEFQILLVASLSQSPYALTANYLATYLAARWGGISLSTASTIGIIASVTTSIAETILISGTPFALVALQAGVAFMGSIAGNTMVQKLPEIAHQGLAHITYANNIVKKTFCFWSNQKNCEEKVYSSSELIKSGSSYDKNLSMVGK